MKTLKDIEMQYNPCHTSGEPVVCSVDELRSMVKKWIEFLESESGEYLTDWPHGHWQAEILKKIFNLEGK